MAGFYNDDPVQAAVDAEEELATAAREAAQAAQAAAESSEAAAAASETAAAASAASASTSASSASTSATNAAISAATASSAETAAGNYSTSAGDSAVSAAASADSATAAAAAASSSKSAAAASAAAAAVSESNAAGSAASASSSESSAADSATAASGSASAAASSAAAASASETAAQNSSIAAGNNAILAINSATAAAASESAAASSASSASTSATNAASSASSAGAAATNAAISEAGAAASGTAAASSETAAALSATDAASSAASAASSEAAASTSAASASSSELSASTSATNAAASETAAAASQAAAATSQSAAAASQTASATSASNASGSEAGALSARASAEAARDEAETHKNNAYTYAQSAASAVAYQDLTAIAASKADTAVDVFVYDTSRDSDGGAWRHRTQHTSWYNETLNTATRGSRREFPAVAVIVAESNQVTIYDGDDPSLPMWMVFNAVVNKNSLLGYSTSFNSIAVTAGNGAIFVASNSGVTTTGGYQQVNFLNEVLFRMRADVKRQSIFNIAQRNNGFSDAEAIETTSQVIVSGLANDVAMTVLPNAPIDAATGLPVPTIAVATDGGVSVIKDDGTVVDLTYSLYAPMFDVSFTDSNGIIATNRLIGGDAVYILGWNTIPLSDSVNGQDFLITTGSVPTYVRKSAYIETALENVVGSDGGVTKFGFDVNTIGNSLAAYISSTYNTGWMNGDIQLATLSDTDDTDVTGSELVTNGTFDTDVSGWSANGGSSINWDAGTLELTPAGYNNYARQYITFPEAGWYILTFDVTDVALGSGGNTYCGFYASNLDSSLVKVVSISRTTPASYTVTAYMTPGGQTQIRLFAGSNTGYVNFDNVSVRLAEPDRSVNGKGLIVNGTITKNPVATGADLVAYSGFSAANYLEQPYNSDLDFGTGDFCIMGWGKDPVGNNGSWLDRNLASDGANANNGIKIFTTTPDEIAVRVGQGATNILSGVFLSGNWQFVSLVRKSGVVYLYVDGLLRNSVANTTDVSKTDATLTFGVDATKIQVASNLSLALWRISATAPTAEQIAKIYEDEKFLFQEGAQATLYGSSDSVTALAHDEVTDLLHVGTSAGRSVFQGLRRVDNTTDAVGVAISAYDGLVVED